MTNATQFPLNSREWSRWVESRLATIERSINPTATRVANEIASKVFFENGGGGDGDTYQVFTPIGAPIPWLTDTLPPGFVELNGQLLPRAAPYDKLFATYGTKYGAGDGSTTFGTPNMAGRTMVGLDPADAAMDATGDTGGAKTHTLSVNEMPAHNHGGATGSSPITDNGSTNFSTADGAAGSTYMRAGSDSGGRYGANIQNSSHTHSIPSQGGTQPHNNMPPYMASRWITRYQDVVVPPPNLGYSVAPLPDTLVLRDAAGRSQVVGPVTNLDIANKEYVDSRVYVHDQPAPAAVWTINHNLGFNPDVATFNSGSIGVMAEVHHLSATQTQVTFLIPTAGFARCS